MVKSLNKSQQYVMENVWFSGLSESHQMIVNTLDAYWCEVYDGVSVQGICELTGLSYETVNAALPMLELFGYIIVQRDHKNRMYPNGVIPMHGFDLSEVD